MALEQSDAERFLDLGETPEHGGMIDPHLRRGARQAARVRYGLDEAEVVPGDISRQLAHLRCNKSKALAVFVLR